MGEKLRNSGIYIVGDVPWGTHFCQFYQTKEDLMDILVPYFKTGLENNELCMWVTSEPLDAEEAKGALKITVPDFDTYLANGQIEIIPDTHVYVKNGVFDSKKILNNWIEKISYSLASGYDGLRLSLNTFWPEETDWDYFVDYEEEVDSIIGKHHMIALCAYPLDKCNAIGIINTVSNHQFVLAKKDGKWERIENVGKKTAIRSAEEDEIKLGEALDNPENSPERLMQLEKAYISLKESEKGLTEAQRMAHLGSWDLDIATEESKWSDEMHRIFGLDPHEFGSTDKTFLRYVHPEDRKYVINAIQDALRGKPYNIDYRIILANGEESAVHEQREITFDRKEMPVRIIGTIQDIAARKKVEKALKIARDYNRSLIDSSLDLLFVTDPDGKITDVNKAAVGAIGYLREELIGTDFTNYFTDPEQAREDYQNVFRKGSVLNRELEIKHKDGHITPVLYNSSVRMNESGEIIGVFAAAHDITERKKADEQLNKIHDLLEEKVKERTAELEEAYESLKESEKSLAEAQKMAHIGNWEWDIATDKAHWSDELYRIYGRTPQELGATYDELLSYVHPDDRDHMDNAHRNALIGEPYSVDIRIILANGEERTVHMQSKVVFDEKNIPIQLKGIVQDITERKKAEEKIKILANAVESSNDAIITESLEGIAISWNKGAEHVYGYSSEETMGKDISIIEPADLKGEVRQLIEKIKQGKKVENYETLRLKKDGILINVSISLSPVFIASGELVAILSIARDITERKRAEETLRESEARMRRFYESGMFGLLYFNLDGTITDANDKFLEIVGYTREDLQNGRVNWDKMTPPEYRLLDEHCIAELKSKSVGTPYEKEYIRKDGSRVPLIIGTATFNEAHDEGVAVVIDITERKKAEERIKILASAVESSNDAIITESLEGITTSWNKGAEQIYGYSAEEIVGKDISILEPADLKGEIRQLVEKIKQGKMVKNYETLRLRKDGTLINVSITLSPVFNEFRELVAISAITRDITGRIKAEETLEKIEKTRIKEIHHRIKNNLQIISSFLSLQAEEFSDTKTLEAFKESQNRVFSMALIHEELYKGDDIDTLNFAAYLRNLTADLFRSYGIGNNNISLKLDLEQVYLGMDTAIPLGIIVNELVSNTLKHAFPAGRIGEIQMNLHKAEIPAAKNGISDSGPGCIEKDSFDYILRVADNGKGMPEEIDFENTDSLGLQLVNILVEQIDGCIELKRNNGTEFTIWFKNVEE